MANVRAAHDPITGKPKPTAREQALLNWRDRRLQNAMVAVAANLAFEGVAVTPSVARRVAAAVLHVADDAERFRPLQPKPRSKKR